MSGIGLAKGGGEGRMEQEGRTEGGEEKTHTENMQVECLAEISHQAPQTIYIYNMTIRVSFCILPLLLLLSTL